MTRAESLSMFSRNLSLQTKYCMKLMCTLVLTKLPSGDSEFTMYSLFHDINSILLALKCKEYFYSLG